MKTNAEKTSPRRVAQRDLFEELRQGLTALADVRNEKQSLRTHKAAPK